ncbi:C2 domain-containing protein 5-like [Rhinoderma darwinii]|uniref:C2 domain-containing protein 5-like n=1 Tax=Rhinoderma darwinii TaxID=43563 RepID=UPI003F674E9B
MRAQTIRRGSVKTITSLDKASPLGEGNLRNRPGAALGSPTVTVVKMTPLSFIQGAKITKYLGIINMFFIRETTSLREEGGVSGFLHAFICEVFAMVRAHVAALGGNAVVSYIMKQCVFMENTNKNQAQCLINVSGDAVIFIRESEVDVASSLTHQQSSQTMAGEGTLISGSFHEDENLCWIRQRHCRQRPALMGNITNVEENVLPSDMRQVEMRFLSEISG